MLRPKHRKPSRLPRQNLPKGIQRDYARRLRDIVRRQRIGYEPLLQALPSILSSRRDDSERMDAGEARRTRHLLEIAAERATLSTPAVEAVAEEFARRIETHQRRELARQLKSALGLDVWMNDGPVVENIELFVSENVALIKDLPAKMYRDIEGEVLRGVSEGALHRDLAKTINEKFKLGEKRAALIARDQTGKMYGAVTASRHKALGLKRFIWRSVGDERVREEHSRLNRQSFSYDNPPQEGLPGQPVLCRCYPDLDPEELLGE